MLFPALVPLQTSAKPTVVLVHGAFADASGWSRVIPILQKDGFKVIAVQEPLTSLADDVAATRRAIARAGGPVVLVGHSYGGAVISSAALYPDSPVKALVYVAAIAPEKGEAFPAVAARFPATPLASALAPDAAGYLTIKAESFRDAFAGDLPESETRVMAATQKPIFGGALAGPFDAEPAWKSLPSWYIVSTDDHAIDPGQERFYAKRIGAKTVEIKASHVSFLSHPKEVAKVIEAASTGK